MTRIQFDEWLTKHYRSLVKTARKMEAEPDQSDDLLQETITRILHHKKYRIVKI